MKKLKNYLSVITLTLLLFGMFSNEARAQAPADPSIDTGINGPSQGVVGAGATLASGMYILLLLGGVYGSYKIYEIRRKKLELSEEGIGKNKE